MKAFLLTFLFATQVHAQLIEVYPGIAYDPKTNELIWREHPYLEMSHAADSISGLNSKNIELARSAFNDWGIKEYIAIRHGDFVEIFRVYDSGAIVHILGFDSNWVRENIGQSRFEINVGRSGILILKVIHSNGMIVPRYGSLLKITDKQSANLQNIMLHNQRFLIESSEKFPVDLVLQTEAPKLYEGWVRQHVATMEEESTRIKVLTEALKLEDRGLSKREAKVVAGVNEVSRIIGDSSKFATKDSAEDFDFSKIKIPELAALEENSRPQPANPVLDFYKSQKSAPKGSENQFAVRLSPKPAPAGFGPGVDRLGGKPFMRMELKKMCKSYLPNRS